MAFGRGSSAGTQCRIKGERLDELPFVLRPVP